MANGTDRQRAASVLLEDESLIAKLKDDEAKALVDWAMSELDTPNGTAEAHVKEVRDAMAEINTLVGERLSLVSDDLEERMNALLVGDLDPKSQIRLEREREVAQVTAEKDHIEGVDLVRRFTAIASATYRAKAHAPIVSASAGTAVTTITMTDTPEPARPAPAVRARPIPRPSKIEPPKPGFWERLLGRK